jgi:hypothetical protein
MIETFALTALIFLIFNRKKKERRPRTIDGEYQQLIKSVHENSALAQEIKNYLLWIIASNNDDAKKFSQEQIDKARQIIDKGGPSAFYWMSDIAAQMALLVAAQINGIPTNVNVELGHSATAEDVVRIVVQG